MLSKLRPAIAAFAVGAALLAFPALASAWSVTVHMHGSGQVVETTTAALMNCTYGGVSEASTDDCVAGATEPGYGHGFIVNLQARVPQVYYDRGWRFSKWVDSNAGGGQINCDPQGTAGNHFAVDCQFQIFENLQTNLYFDDIHGPNGTAITSVGPAAATNSTSASFEFNATDDPDALYDCRLDPPGAATGSFAPCGSPADKTESYTGLANGEHTFFVRGRDPSGNLDATPESRTWTVDTVAPTVSITGGPTGTTSSTSATFSVSSTEGTPACTLDGMATPCGTTKTGLADGSHTFAASATDAAGNTGTASRTWTVAAPPETTITADPGSASGSTAQFAFISSELGSTFTCTLDGDPLPSCSSPKSLTGLTAGAHTFTVAATDGAGNTDATPDSHTWTVDLTAPDTVLLDGPAEGSSTPSQTATFTFASPDSTSTFECRLDDQPFAPCTSPATFNGLPNGDHVFEVRAKDAAGNVDATPVRRAWRVNTLDADSDGINRPADCNDGDAAIRPGATDTAGDGVDQDCSGADATATQQSGQEAVSPTPITLTPTLGTLPTSAAGTLKARFAVRGARTTVRQLAVVGLGSAATVKVACKGRGCPFRSRAVKPVAGKADLTRAFRKRHLQSGAVVKITITSPGQAARVITLRFRKGKPPVRTVA